ncbi:hypothetical protein SxD43FB_21710 [Sphingobium sp. D43FB]|nr:hypothetical protein SxD43FB_21710 [Sphingobium sp. D43FB]
MGHAIIEHYPRSAIAGSNARSCTISTAKVEAKPDRLSFVQDAGNIDRRLPCLACAVPGTADESMATMAITALHMNSSRI